MTLSLNTDGISIFKSSNKSIWPIFLTINELPLSERFKISNTVLAAIYCAPSKPNFSILLEPLISDLKKLEVQGIQLIGLSHKCFIFLTCICADKPARCQLTNTVQFDGRHGCLYCYDEGKSENRKWVYPQSGEHCQRIHEHHSKIIEKNNFPSYGIKGVCAFQKLRFINFFSSFPIDYMHGSLLGVGKNLIHRIFSKQFKSLSYSLHGHLSEIDRKILNIKLPKYVPRNVSSLSLIEKWKANEIRSFFYTYGIHAFPCFNRDRYLKYLLASLLF